jgi:chorismate mutase
MTRRPGKADSPAEQLNRWRREIDDLDEVILEALELRARTVREIGRYKKDNGLPILDATRERFILDRVVEKSGLLPTEVRGEIFAHMIQRMREWESTLD